MEWELYDGQATRGPFGEEALVAAIRAGQIPPAAQVRPVGAEEWKPLRSHAPFAMALGMGMGQPPVSVPMGPAQVAVQGVVVTRPETGCVTYGCGGLIVGVLILVIWAMVSRAVGGG